MTLLLAAVVDLTVILAVALTATVVMRGRSAALRHSMLAAAVIAGAAAPALELVLPEWPVPFARTASPPIASTLRFSADAAPIVPASSVEPVAPALPWPTIVVAAWMAGALAGLLGLATGVLRLARFSARCTPIRSGPWRATADQLAAEWRMPRVELLQSTHPSVLVTWGLFTPKIILPGGASAWTETRRRIVLAHEMAHIRRRDWLLHMGAEALRAVHWINPLVWLACRRLRQESEYACDDAVLSGGVAPTEYATHLLDVARHAIGRGTWVSAPAIAHPSTLERRIAAMLIEQRNRAPLTRLACAAAVTGIVAVALPITALAVSRATAPAAIAPDVVLAAPLAQEPAAPPASTRVRAAADTPRNGIAPAPAQPQSPARLTVTVLDPSGGVLPGVEATLDDPQAGLRHRLVSDASGRFGVRELMPGRYEMVLSLAGFARVTSVIPVAAGADIQRTITLPVGSLEETVIVGCGSPAAGLTPSVPAPDVEATIVATRQRLDRAQRVLIAAATLRARRVAPAGLAQDRSAGLPVRVGGQIRSPRPQSRVNPVCPGGVVTAGDTTVVLVGRIGVDGFMNDVTYVPPAAGEPLPVSAFVDAALEAVRQWTFTPTLLNNQPVDVSITVRVLFQRR